MSRDDAAATADDLVDLMVRSAMTRLVSGLLRHLVLVSLGPDGVKWCGVRLDSGGVPTVRGFHTVDVWKNLVPGERGSALRRYLLAGGVDDQTGDVWRDRNAFRFVTRTLLTTAGVGGAEPDVEYLLLRRYAHWRTIDVFAEALCDHALPAGDVTLNVRRPIGLRRLTQEWCAAAPLRTGFDLAVADLDRDDGRITITTVPLFLAGVTRPPGDAARVTVKLERPDLKPGRVLLPVLENVPGLVSKRPVSSMAEVLLTGPTSVDFVLQHGRAVLDAVHSVRHGVQAVSSSLSGLDWPTVAEQLPHHGAVDVAIAVERCGSTDVVRNRLEVLGAIIKAMAARERRMPGMVRVAVISYTDHDARHGRPPSDRPCDVVRFDAPEAVQDIVSGWEPVTMRSNYGTSSEDALNEASKLEWRAPALRSFVIIGSRPPSVRSMGGTYAVICPQDLDWRLELKTLRAMNVRTIAVTDPVPWQKYSELGTPVERTKTAWEEIGGSAPRFDLAAFRIEELEALVTPGAAAPFMLAMRASGAR